LILAPHIVPEMMTVAKSPVTEYRFHLGHVAITEVRAVGAVVAVVGVGVFCFADLAALAAARTGGFVVVVGGGMVG